MTNAHAHAWELQVPIAKMDGPQQLVFGWLSVSKTSDGEYVVDHQGDVIPIAELEQAAYAYMLESQESDAMHEGPPVGRLVESVVFTAEKRKAMGIPDGILPDGWWVGYKVDDPAVWLLVQSGTYKAFSIGGTGYRAPID